MNKKIVVLGCLGFTFTSAVWAGPSAPSAPSAKDVMVKNEEARKIEELTSSATLKTGGGGSPDRLKKFTWWRKLSKNKVHYNTLTRFHEPAEVRGQGILFMEHEDGNNDVMLYLPTFKKIRRVESEQQSSSFMGSEFSYSDIAAPHVEDYQYKMVKESEKCPSPEAVKIQCYLIESKPATEKVKDRTGYSRGQQWVRHDNHMTVKGEFYDLEGKLWKKMDASKIQTVDAAKTKWMAHFVRMENARNGRYTELEFKSVKTDVKIPDSTFSQQNLSKEQ